MATHVELPKFDSRSRFVVQTARWALVAFANVLLAAVLGAIVVATPMGPRELVAIVWMISLMVLVRRAARRGEPRLAAMILLVNLGVAGGVVVTATAAPGKTKDKVLERQMFLPQRDLTLAELQEYLESIDRPRDAVPTHITLWFSADEAATKVRFPGENLTLREFVTAVETQTPLRARFSSCGNSHTILWGEDCGQLHIRDRRRPY